jgi:hypothetical protein
MFKSNCEGSHFPAFVFNTRDLPSWPTRQTVVQRAASAKRAPWPIAALAPNALPNGVLVHRNSRLAPPVCVFTLAPPVPSQVLTVSRLEGRLIPLVVYETHREDRAAGAWRRPSNGPSAPRTAQLHARIRQRRLPHELPRDGRRSSVRALCRTGGRGRPVAGVRDPEARDLGRSGPRASGFPQPQATLARARGEGGCFGAACQHRLSARPSSNRPITRELPTSLLMRRSTADSTPSGVSRS